jgi:hypothetical protein
MISSRLLKLARPSLVHCLEAMLDETIRALHRSKNESPGRQARKMNSPFAPRFFIGVSQLCICQCRARLRCSASADPGPGGGAPHPRGNPNTDPPGMHRLGLSLTKLPQAEIRASQGWQMLHVTPFVRSSFDKSLRYVLHVDGGVGCVQPY